MNYSCMDCVDRAIGCHSSCERYIAEKAERDADNEAKRKDKLAHSMLTDSYIKRKTPLMKSGKLEGRRK